MIPRDEQWGEIAAAPGGDLALTSYAVLLAAMERAGRSCVLSLERRPITKRVFLSDGRPIECRSNLAHETFGRFLRSEGRLSKEEHRSALSESVSREVPLGEVLIDRGLLSPQDTYSYLQKNLARKLLDGFTWDRGEFEVSDHGQEPDTTININAQQLILTGVLKLTPEAEIAAAIAKLGADPLSLDPQWSSDGSGIRLTGRAERVVQALELQPLALEELASIISLPGEEVARIVYALALIGRVVPAREIAQRRLSGEAALSRGRIGTGEDPRSTLSEAAAAVDPADDQALLLRQTKIVESYLSFRRKDSFDFLDLQEGSSAAEIDNAYLRAAETYAPWSLQAMGVTDFAEQGKLLFLRAARAYAELENSEARGALIHRRKVLGEQEADRKRAKFSIETDLLDSEEQFKKGLALARQGDLVKALGFLEFAVDCDPQSALYRAELAFRRDQLEPHRHRKQSIEDLREAARIDPLCGLAHYYLGLILSDQGDGVEAEEALRRSIKLMSPDRRPIEALRELTGRKKR